MAKKKYRSISVNGIKYGWNVSVNHEGFTIKIFKEKKEVYCKYQFGRNQVTPSVIKEIVLKEFK